MSTKGLRQFLDPEQQRAWLEDETTLPDAASRTQSLEQRFKFAERFEKLLRRPQADDVLDILRLYGATCLPIPRATERFYWSVSCLPGSPDKPLTRVNASWMELFALLPDNPSPLTRPVKASPLVGEVGGGRAASAGPENLLSAEQSADAACSAPPPNPPHEGEGLSQRADLRARIILHLSDFTTDGSPEPDQLDTDLLESLVERPEDVSHAVWRNGKGILIAKVRGDGSIRAFLADPRGLRAIRNFNLTHMNRGRNAYQASHCHSLADVMLGE
ncbi:MAG TPA: hypothetical protein VFW35_13265 [Sphingomicrobium sp.]|nr:hypothetical protein [Sphingomicrobium sp.]